VAPFIRKSRQSLRGGRSVGIVRSRTQAMEFFFFVLLFLTLYHGSSVRRCFLTQRRRFRLLFFPVLLLYGRCAGKATSKGTALSNLVWNLKTMSLNAVFITGDNSLNTSFQFSFRNSFVRSSATEAVTDYRGWPLMAMADTTASFQIHYSCIPGREMTHTNPRALYRQYPLYARCERDPCPALT
jgi:hypothetical protein